MTITQTPYPPTIGGFSKYVRDFIAAREAFVDALYFDTDDHQVLTIG